MYSSSCLLADSDQPLVSGHGISKERIERAFELGKKWFQLSNEEKSLYKLDLTEYVGWKGERLLLNSDGKGSSTIGSAEIKICCMALNAFR